MKKKETAEVVTAQKRITLASTVSVEMEERKSIFIGHATPITSEEEARAIRILDNRIAEEYEKVYWHGLWKRRKGTK